MNRHALSASGPKPGASTNFATPAPAPCPFQVRVRILANGKKALMLLVVLTLALMIMVMTAAAFTFLVIMMVPATALTVPVVMMMVAAAALAFFVIVVMMPAATFAFRVVMMVAAIALAFPVVMVMVSAAALAFLMIVVMMTATTLALFMIMVVMMSSAPATTATAAASMPARKRHGFKGRLNLFDGQPDAFEQLLELSIERKGKTTLGLRNTNAACHQGIHCLLHQIHVAGYLEDGLDASLNDVEMAAFINQNVTNFQRPGFPKRILQLLACNRFKGLGQLQAISICQDNLVSACKQSRGRS